MPFYTQEHKIVLFRIMIAVPVLFILLGILIKYAKLYFLIAGYHTMSKEEKSKQDIDGIATVFRNAMFGMALIMIIGHFISKWMEDPQIETISLFGAIIIGLPYLLITTNSGKYKIDKNNGKSC